MYMYSQMRVIFEIYTLYFITNAFLFKNVQKENMYTSLAKIKHISHLE